MSINVTIVTTANRTRRFTQTDSASIQDILDSLRRAGQMFSNRTLIIGSVQETEIFAPSTITRIEIETQLDLGAYLPQLGESRLTSIPEGSSMPPPEVTETHFSGRVDFYFEGGDSLPVWVFGPRPIGNNERMAQLTRLFEQPVIMYKLPSGGIGFMNPSVMTRARIASATEKLPLGSWQLNPVD
jgi:hypothetical protein